MKNKVLLLLFVLIQIFPEANAREIITVKGAITSGGKGVAGVPVTDGVSIVETDKKGKYILTTTSDMEYVYYTLPSGYESPVVEGVPVFYQSLRPGETNQEIDFEIFKAPKSQQKHAFIVWADPQVLDPEDFEKLKPVVADIKNTVHKIHGEIPVHAISVGDQVFDRLHFFDDYKKAITPLDLPFYQVIGNHDMDYNNRSDELSAVSYAKAFGPAWYSFNKGNVHYVALKDVFYYGFSYRYIGYITETQLKWLEQDLAKVKPGSTVVVSLHIPTVSIRPERGDGSLSGSVTNKDALFRILEPYNTHILAGHSHTQWNTVVSPTLFEHVHAAASGAWWQGEISTDGSPMGYTVYHVDGDSLTWYFKGVDKSTDYQFKLYPLGADENYPDCIVANVFNYDPAWEVKWFEDGVLMGDMEKYWGVDPTAKNMYQPGKNKRHSWLSAGRTSHLFRAPLKNPGAKVTVVVRDRFEKEYREELSPFQAKVNEGEWKLVWRDEFSASGLPDTTRWNYATRGNSYGWGNGELQWYTEANPKNATVSEGTLKIVARREETSSKEYSSARLTTQNKGDWKYGKIEVRAKVPSGRGTWPAIWMLPTKNSYGGWPHSGEIDIMEHVGYDPYRVHSTVHTGAYNHVKGTQVGKPYSLPTATTDFQIYTTEWDEEEIRSYVNGELYFTFKNEKTGPEAWPFDQPFHLILNLAIGGGWGGRKGVDNDLFPHVFEIDYVRVYQR